MAPNTIKEKKKEKNKQAATSTKKNGKPIIIEAK